MIISLCEVLFESSRSLFITATLALVYSVLHSRLSRVAEVGEAGVPREEADGGFSFLKTVRRLWPWACWPCGAVGTESGWPLLLVNSLSERSAIRQAERDHSEALV